MKAMELSNSALNDSEFSPLNLLISVPKLEIALKI